MRQFVITIAGITAIVAASIASARPAAAETPSTGDYRTAMRAFVKDLDNWAEKLEVAADAAVVKPELGCGAELAELAQIGDWMTADLEGTARLAPDYLAGVHGKLTSTVATMGDQAELACYDAGSAAEAIHSQRAAFDWAIRQIQLYVRYGASGN
jgi:hypothetical protein